MRILHYFLGFPPYRTGGLTKYCYDLMNAQVDAGYEVVALWPGKMELFNKGVKFRKRKSVNGIINYELINPLPIPLDEGIKDIKAYIGTCEEVKYECFLEYVCPDVIHIHTLMGLHDEFYHMAKKKGIKTIYTTHDYFGICPKVTLYKLGNACNDDKQCEDCCRCNINALSINKIRLLQSPIYRIMKNSYMIKKIRAKHRKDFFDDNIELSNETCVNSNDYLVLREYYTKILESIDTIHFNSSLSENIYKRYITPKHSVTMSIAHQGVKDNRYLNEWYPSVKLRIVFLAPPKPFKGYEVLKQALDEVWSMGKHDFELYVFGAIQDKAPYMIIREDGFKTEELGMIMNSADVLIAPSVWYETFGFTVLEAISYGVPVIISDNVGAKDIVSNGGIIVEAGNVEALKSAILSMSKDEQKKLRNNIRKNKTFFTWEEFLDLNNRLYEELININECKNMHQEE